MKTTCSTQWATDELSACETNDHSTITGGSSIPPDKATMLADLKTRIDSFIQQTKSGLSPANSISTPIGTATMKQGRL